MGDIDMASAYGELELEALGELEGEFEQELEFGFGETASWQNGVVRAADRAILESEHEFESEFESESEFEFEHEGLGEISPVTRVYPDAMMEHLAHSAMEAESEHEAAEGFLPLIPMVASKLLPLAAKALPKLAGKLLPRVAGAVSRVTPHLTRSVGKLTRTLYRNPQTRPLLRAVPSIARRAVTSIAKRAATGQPVTPRHAVRILARQNHGVLSNPQLVKRVLRRSRLIDGRYHRLAGIPATGSNYRWRWRNGLWQPGAVAGPGGTGAPDRIGGTGAAVPAVMGRRATMRGCPTCGSTVVHARGGGPGCSVVVVR
jgi:hypothetical protein